MLVTALRTSAYLGTRSFARASRAGTLAYLDSLDAAREENVFLREKLNFLKADYEKKRREFEQVINATAQEKTALHKAHKEYQVRTSAQVEALTAEVEAARIRNDTLSQDLSKTADALEVSQNSLRNAESNADELAELREALVGAEKREASARAELDAAHAEIQDPKATLSDLQREVSHRTTQPMAPQVPGALVNDFEAVLNGFVSAKDARDRLGTDVQELMNLNQQLHNELAQQKAALACSERDASAHRDEAAALRTAMEALHTQVDTRATPDAESSALRAENNSLRSQVVDLERRLQHEKSTAATKLKAAKAQLGCSKREQDELRERLAEQQAAAEALDTWAQRKVDVLQTEKTQELAACRRELETLQQAHTALQQAHAELTQKTDDDRNSFILEKARFDAERQKFELEKNTYDQKIKDANAEASGAIRSLENTHASKVQAMQHQIDALRRQCEKLRQRISFEENSAQRAPRSAPAAPRVTPDEQLQMRLLAAEQDANLVRKKAQQHHDAPKPAVAAAQQQPKTQPRTVRVPASQHPKEAEKAESVAFAVFGSGNVAWVHKNTTDGGRRILERTGGELHRGAPERGTHVWRMRWTKK